MSCLLVNENEIKYMKQNQGGQELVDLWKLNLPKPVDSLRSILFKQKLWISAKRIPSSHAHA